MNKLFIKKQTFRVASSLLREIRQPTITDDISRNVRLLSIIICSITLTFLQVVVKRKPLRSYTGRYRAYYRTISHHCIVVDDNHIV